MPAPAWPAQAARMLCRYRLGRIGLERREHHVRSVWRADGIKLHRARQTSAASSPTWPDRASTGRCCRWPGPPVRRQSACRRASCTASCIRPAARRSTTAVPARSNHTSSAPGEASRYAMAPVLDDENSAWKVTGLKPTFSAIDDGECRSAASVSGSKGCASSVVFAPEQDMPRRVHPARRRRDHPAGFRRIERAEHQELGQARVRVLAV